MAEPGQEPERGPEWPAGREPARTAGGGPIGGQPVPPRGRLLRGALRELLVARQLDRIAELAGERRRVLPALIPLTYDRDPEIAHRAVEAMGVAADRVADEDPEAVREVLRRLNWLITEESGGICWRAPEAMAEIARRRPERFAAYVRIVLHLIRDMAEEDLEHFRPGILRGIGRLGGLGGEDLEEVLPWVVAALSNPDPQTRGMGVWALLAVGRSGAVLDRPGLLEDAGVVELYEDGILVRTTVGDLARRAR